MEPERDTELEALEEEAELGEAGGIVLVGEPMGLFIAEETGKLENVRRFSAAIAGAEYNVAVGLSRLGCRAHYCTKLGDDPIGRKILRAMEENNIHTDLISMAPGASTGIMLKGKTPSGDPDIAYFRRGSAASGITPHDMDKLDLYGCDFLHVTGIFPAVSKSALEAVRRLILRAHALDMFISFDPNLRPQLWADEKEMRRTLNALAEDVDLVLPGLGEGKILTGRDTPEGIAAFYHDRGVKSVVVKLGEKGAFWSTGAENGYVPAFPVEHIVDTVGAGDGFAAGVLSAVAEGLSLKEATERGAVIGAVQLTSESENDALPTRAELAEILAHGHLH